jgi:hypothetical protein
MKTITQQIMTAALAVLGVMAVGNRADAVVFDNGGGDFLFSNPLNWPDDALPANRGRIDVQTGTTAGSPALIDDSWENLTGNTYFQDASGAYGMIVTNGTLDFINLYIGNMAGKTGTLTVQNGGTLYHPSNTGGLVSEPWAPDFW